MDWRGAGTLGVRWGRQVREELNSKNEKLRLCGHSGLPGAEQIRNAQNRQKCPRTLGREGAEPGGGGCRVDEREESAVPE